MCISSDISTQWLWHNFSTLVGLPHSYHFDTMLSLLDGIYLLSPCSPTNTSHSEYQFLQSTFWLDRSPRGHASVSFGYGQERSSRSYDSSTTMKDLVRRIYLLSIATNTCETYCLTLIKSKLLAGSYDSCFTHLLLRVWGRVKKFIYWR